jgi:UDPglucose 6-dehydrogenase
MIVTDLETAEIIKHASNSFLAMKVSYINAVARLCEKAGADVDTVAKGMGLDPRIGPHHLYAGIGYGGFCFPKDLAAFITQAEELGVDLGFLDHVRRINEEQRARLVEKVVQAVWNLDGKAIGVWGLSFKAGTDDLREAPSLVVIPALEQEGATVRAFDPAAGAEAKAEFGNTEIVSDALSAIEGVDGRNLWPVERMAELGFTYLSFGRPDVIAGEIRRPN